MENQPVKVIDLMFFWRLLRRFWILIAICSVLGAIVGYSLAQWVVKPTYQATSLVFAWAKLSHSGSTMEELDELSSNLDLTSAEGRKVQQEITQAKLRNIQQMGMQVNISNQMMPDFQALLNSRKMRSQIDQALPKDAAVQALLKARIEFAQAAQAARKAQGAEAAEGEEPEDNTTLIPNYSLLVNPLPKTRFVEVSVLCHDEEFAPLIINVAMKEFTQEASRLLGMSNTEVIDPAQSASRVAPNKSRYTLFGFLIGLLVSGGFAFLVVFFDKSIGDLKELEERINLPVLGVLPEVTIGSGNDNELWQQNNKSVYGEAIRALRVNVEYLLPDDNRAKLFLITSINKGDGKSSIISSLAVALACLEKKVLLIDMDLRRPRQHRIFRLPNQDGLVDMLVAKKTFGELVHHNVKVPGLDVLTSGTIPLTPTDLLASPRLENFLKEESKNYDYIFLDAPPVLGLADPLILGKLADATIFACDFKSANVDKLRNVTERLRQAEIKLAGLVLNRFSLQGKSDYYYYYQHYYYGYHYNYTSSDESSDEIAELPDQEQKSAKRHKA